MDVPPTPFRIRRSGFLDPCRQRSSVGLLLSLVAALGLGACASAPVALEVAVGDPLDLYLESQGIDPTRVVRPYALSDELEIWAREAAPPERSIETRLELLAQALLDSNRLDLEYSWGYTGTAEEVFESRKANCLAFTNLFLGMAREVGVPAFFLAVETETYRKRGEFVVISDHIAVGWGAGPDIRYYDFSENQSEGVRKVRRIADLTAIAMFHSNKGVEALQKGHLAEALDWLRLAVALDADLPSAWVNLGVARRRAGDFDGASLAYKRSLEIDPSTYSAYQNLAGLLRLQNRTEEAEEFERALRDSPNRNPYSYLTLGDISFRRGRFDEARRFYRRAAFLGDETAESYAALGQIAILAGDLRAARKMLRRAQKIDEANERTQKLRRMIASNQI